MYFLSFSNKDLNFDFFSKLSALRIILTSSIFFESISSIIFNILSVTLLIIIIFSLSKRDLDNILSIKSFIFSRTSLSSYFIISSLFFIRIFVASFLKPSFLP